MSTTFEKFSGYRKLFTMLGSPNYSGNTFLSLIRSIFFISISLVFTLLIYAFVNMYLGVNPMSSKSVLDELNKSLNTIHEPYKTKFAKIRFEERDNDGEEHVIFSRVSINVGDIDTISDDTLSASVQTCTGENGVYCFLKIERMAELSFLPNLIRPLYVSFPVDIHPLLRVVESRSKEDEKVAFCDGSTATTPSVELCEYTRNIQSVLESHLFGLSKNSLNYSNIKIARVINGSIQFTSVWLFFGLIIYLISLSESNIKSDSIVQSVNIFSKNTDLPSGLSVNSNETPWHKNRGDLFTQYYLFHLAKKELRKYSNVFGTCIESAFLELRLEAHAALASAPIVEGSRDYSTLTTFVESKANSLSNAAYIMLTYPRYFIWLIPTVGFIGTVVGISSALSLTTELQNADLIQKAIAKSNVSSQIGMAFDTTLVALILSSLGFLYLNSIEKKWEFNITNNKDNVLREMVTPQNIIAANQIKPIGLKDEMFTEQLTEPVVKVSRTILLIFTLSFVFLLVFFLKLMGINVLDGIANMARSIGLPIF